MSDLISRQAAIDALTEYGNGRVVYIGVEEAVRRIEQLSSAQPEQQWIPCSERLPEDGRYLCTYKNDKGICVDFGRVIDGAWWIMPIAWMPLPEPWRGEEHE